MPLDEKDLLAMVKKALWAVDENVLEAFVVESNKIEKISRSPTVNELSVTRDFLSLPVVRVEDLKTFVHVCAPGAELRTRSDMNVAVGDHHAPRGGPEIEKALQKILNRANRGADPHRVHLDYETLHPFIDGNGRSGRVLWAWQMLKQKQWPGISLGFLHAWYYQSLSHGRK